MNTLVEAINELRAQGYVCDFIIDDGAVQCRDSDNRFKPDELTIEKIYRFEGDSNPDDMSVLFGISASDGTKGIIIDAYGIYENTEVSEFMKKIKITK